MDKLVQEIVDLVIIHGWTLYQEHGSERYIMKPPENHLRYTIGLICDRIENLGFHPCCALLVMDKLQRHDCWPYERGAAAAKRLGYSQEDAKAMDEACAPNQHEEPSTLAKQLRETIREQLASKGIKIYVMGKGLTELTWKTVRS